MAKFPKSPVPALKGEECGASYHHQVEVDVPYKGMGGASYKLPALSDVIVPLPKNSTESAKNVARQDHHYHRVLNDLREAIESTVDMFSELKQYIDSSNQKAINTQIKNAQLAYNNAYDIAYAAEFRFPTLIEFEGPGQQGAGSGGYGGKTAGSAGIGGSASWSAGSASASGGAKFGVNIPKELVERLVNGVYPSPFTKPSDIPSGQSPGFWPVYEKVPPLIRDASSTTPDGRHQIYYPDIGWIVYIDGPRLDENEAHDEALEAYTRALHNGMMHIRCAQEAITAIASQQRNMKKYDMTQVKQGDLPNKPARAKEKISLAAPAAYTPEPSPSFPEPPEGGFGEGLDIPESPDMPEGQTEDQTEEPAKKKKSNIAILGIAAAAAVLILGKKK